MPRRARKPPSVPPPQNARIPVSTPGHRGIAARLLKKPELESYAERLRTGNYEISASDVEKFINDEFVLSVHSTNVRTLQYFRERQQLHVEYKDSSMYEYDNVSINEALQMAQAQSKGHATWVYLRILGSRTAHKKVYRRIR